MAVDWRLLYVVFINILEKCAVIVKEYNSFLKNGGKCVLGWCFYIPGVSDLRLFLLFIVLSRPTSSCLLYLVE
jgi:hypothetical protein